MSCKYNNCKICGYKTECEIYKEITELTKSCDETQELLDKQIEATYKLDKENAELKDDNKVMADNYSKMEQKFYENITKAKEILREYIRINLLPPIERNFDDEVKLFKQAEQFISEVEK